MKQLIILLLTVFVFISCTDNAAKEKESKVQQFTGSHTRAVWVQEQAGGADTFAFSEHFKLVGFDSQDGQGERYLLDETANFYKPIFTPDGQQVVVSSRTRQEIYLVNFEKGKKKLLGKGVALDVWKDPDTEKIWVYALAGDGPENKYFSTHPLIRFPLNKPSNRQSVWDKTHLSWSNFDLSRDGTLAGGLFPWPDAGILTFAENTWKKYGQGCWTALSPDNSGILWIFDGLHRNLNFINSFTEKSWKVNINNAPGVDGFEVYHPRWSNHVQFMTMTGPYVEGEGGNKIGGGGQGVEIYLGKFSPDLEEIEGWFQVSHNQKADFYPDVWLANGYASNFNAQQTVTQVVKNGEEPANEPEKSEELAKELAEELLFIWENLKAENKLPETGLLGFQQLNVQPVQRAFFNRYLEMELHGAGYKAEWPQKEAASILREKEKLGVEFLFTPKNTAPATQGHLVFIGAFIGAKGTPEDSYGLQVSQLAAGLEIELFAPSFSLAHIQIPDLFHEHTPEHMYIAVETTGIKVYVGGVLKREIQLKDSPFSSWQEAVLLFGETDPATLENDQKNAFNAALSHVALHSKPLSAEEIAAKFQWIAKTLQERQPIETLSFQGTITEVSKVPAPESLGAYSRALVVNRYAINAESVEGEYPEKEILVAQWAVLDRKILPETAAFTVGSQAKLQVHPFDAHQELEGERLMMDMFDPDLELYYQVN
ncbi:MAG: hypothetical protein D3916_06470 [Candidatus Electrothrix sp. MAN1_4]|nr:hypothetical protein [Candidatus Electrothrix sp. MAN1_4]